MSEDKITREAVVGVFTDRTQAEQALNALEQAGFTDEDTGFIVRGPKDPGDDRSPIENDTKLVNESTGSGVLSGGVVGGILGAVATGLIPGIGPVIAGGVLAGVLGGAAAGTFVGGIAGTLSGMGVPEEQAKFYEEEFNAGRPIVTVTANEREDEAWRILEEHGAYNEHTREKS